MSENTKKPYDKYRGFYISQIRSKTKDFLWLGTAVLTAHGATEEELKKNIDKIWSEKQ